MPKTSGTSENLISTLELASTDAGKKLPLFLHASEDPLPKIELLVRGASLHLYLRQTSDLEPTMLQVILSTIMWVQNATPHRLCRVQELLGDRGNTSNCPKDNHYLDLYRNK